MKHAANKSKRPERPEKRAPERPERRPAPAPVPEATPPPAPRERAMDASGWAAQTPTWGAPETRREPVRDDPWLSPQPPPRRTPEPEPPPRREPEARYAPEPEPYDPPEDAPVRTPRAAQRAPQRRAAQPEKKRSKTWLWVLLALLLAAAGFYFASGYFGRDDDEDGGLSYEVNAVTGSIGSGLERLQEMQEMADRSKVTMSINATPMFTLSNADAGVNWLIENPEEQADKLIKVEVYRSDNGEKIYETGFLRPGTYVTGTRPNVDLAEGIYTCVAYFYAFDIDTQEFLGKAGSQITLYVLE